MARRWRGVVGTVLVAALGPACAPPEPSLDVGVREVPTDVVIGTRSSGSTPAPLETTTPPAPVPPPPAPPAGAPTATTTTTAPPSAPVAPSSLPAP